MPKDTPGILCRCFRCILKVRKLLSIGKAFKILDSMLMSDVILDSPTYCIEMTAAKDMFDHYGYMMPHRPRKEMFSKIGVAHPRPQAQVRNVTNPWQGMFCGVFQGFTAGVLT